MSDWNVVKIGPKLLNLPEVLLLGIIFHRKTLQFCVNEMPGIETEIAQHIEGCELEDISDKISIYLKSLEAIAEDKSANEQRNCLQDIERALTRSESCLKLGKG
ncbi:unnamed protein product [Rhizophagus irregularis]|nr:unnamed protein product [Rhizophagus irregularis]